MVVLKSNILYFCGLFVHFHVFARGLETAQAVTPLFNMFILFDVTCHWGGLGGVGGGMFTFDALAHMFDAT